MSRQKKTMNLLAVYNEKPRDTEKIKKICLAVFPCLLLALILAVSGIFASKTMKVKRQVAEIYRETESSQAVMAYQNNTSLAEEVRLRQEMLEYDRAVKESFMRQPVMVKEDFERVYDAAGSRIFIRNLYFESAERTFMVVGVTADPSEVPTYIKRLKETDIFDDVVYYGYAIDDEVANYGFTATCIVKAVEI